MTATNSHTHCLAALATHIPSKSKSVLSRSVGRHSENEKSPTAPLQRMIDVTLMGERNPSCE